jgi:hypothetical protein
MSDKTDTEALDQADREEEAARAAEAAADAEHGGAAGDPEGRDVQSAIRSDEPQPLPDYLGFLGKPGDEVEDFQPGKPGDEVEDFQPGKPGGGAGPAGQPPEAGQVVSGSASSKKYTDAGKSAPGDIDREFLDPNAPAAVGAAGVEGVNRSIEAQKKAESDKADAQREYEARNAEILRQQQEEERYWAGVDERAAAKSAAEAHKHIAAYQQQIAAVRQMAVDPRGPIARLSTGGRVALALGDFAQGFLAAKGINIDVSGQVDKWVDRSIAEQQRRIGQAQAGAEDQLHLWEIARQTSRDDQEARQRYRGWSIAAMQTQLQMNASQYRSASANADAAMINAQLDMEGVKSKQAIWNNTFNQVKQDETLKETHRHNVVMESLDEEKAQLRAAANANKGGKKAKPSVYIPDLTSTGEIKNENGRVIGNRIVGKIDAETPGAAKLAEDTSKDMKLHAGLERDLNEAEVYRKEAVREYSRSKSKYLGQRAFAVSSEAKRNYDAITFRIAEKLAKMSFSRVTPQDVDLELKNALPFEQWYQSGNNTQPWKSIINKNRTELEDSLNAPGIIHVNKNQLDAEDRATLDFTPEGEPAQTRTHVNEPEARKFKSELETRTAIAEAEPESAVTTPIGSEERRGESGSSAPVPMSTPWKALMGAIPQPEAARGVDHLIVAMTDPAKFQRAARESGFEEDVMLKDHRLVLNQAERSLRRISESANDPYVRLYAKAILKKLDSGGTSALSELETEVTTVPAGELPGRGKAGK